MKRKKLNIFLIAILAILNSGLFGQNYIPMNFDDSYWGVNKFEKDGWETDIRYYCQGDTLINDTSFAKLYQSRIRSPWIGLRDTILYNEYTGAIIETESKIVKYIPGGKSNSEIIYDFSLGLGDTVYLSDISFIVNGIDSVNYCGRYHKRYYEVLEPLPIAVIEGIGYSNGILGYYEPFIGEGENTITLDCYFELNNTDCEVCGYILKTDIMDIRNHVYPNPTNNILTVESNKQISRIRLFNSQGKLLRSKDSVNSTNSSVNIGDFVSGVYHLQIQFNTGEYYNTTIIKSDL